jgi:hypothetical protein
MDRSHQLFVLWVILFCGIGQLLTILFKLAAIGNAQNQLSRIESESVSTLCQIESRFAANEVQLTSAGLLTQVTWIANVTYVLDNVSKWYFPVVVNSTLIPSSMFGCTIVKGNWPDRVVPGDLSYPLNFGDILMMIVQGGLGLGVCMVVLIQMYLIRKPVTRSEPPSQFLLQDKF